MTARVTSCSRPAVVVPATSAVPGRRRIRGVLGASLAVVALAGCEEKRPTSTSPGAVSVVGSGSAVGSASSAPSAGEAGVEPPKPYVGPTGTVVGAIRIKGDPPPETPHTYPKGCGGEAAATYGKLFRVGSDGALADAIVSVTKYQGFVPPKRAAIPVTVRGCAYSTRSIAMTDGQHLEVRNIDVDTTSYLPWLDGAKLPAGIIAVPQGEPVKLYSRGYGRYWLRDQLARTFMVAHVFHFHYATTAVTTLDGKYRIEGVPVGKVEVSAMLPQANLLSVTQPLEVKEGENTLDLELTFDKKRDVPEIPEETLPDAARKMTGGDAPDRPR